MSSLLVVCKPVNKHQSEVFNNLLNISFACMILKTKTASNGKGLKVILIQGGGGQSYYSEQYILWVINAIQGVGLLKLLGSLFHSLKICHGKMKQLSEPYRITNYKTSIKI